ncbi:PAS domain-containing protein [Longimicrobium sp.]|uniref:PAS domain-containing protein n=1 Tax=Longimicrobium sp. TaxID=2029185 RepID=UPI002BFACCC9|nr:PAS domain-containing protein [Longimicrobium sp.]HSU16383.1 PAS domain-containing protein [Longimicrobium sp.]
MQATAGVLEKADVLSETELDTLPVGMIQLAPDGKVLKFNQTESALARVAKDDALGKNFFDEVAPCTRVQEFHGRFVEGVEKKSLHTVFDYVFRFRDGRRKNVVISMFYSASTETVWVCVERP